MELQTVYNELLESAVELYHNEEKGLQHFYTVIQPLEKIIEELASIIGEELSEHITSLYDAVRNQDKLALADMIYYEWCDWIEQLAELKGEQFKKQTRAVRKNENEFIEDACANYEKNVYNLKKMHLDIYDDLIEASKTFNAQDEDIIVDLSGNIAVKSEEGYWWGLNSFYNRSHAVKLGIEPLLAKGSISILFIMGMGNLDYIKEIIKKLSGDTIVFIYEPDKRIFTANMYYNDFTEICTRKNTYFFVEGINESKIANFVMLFCNNMTVKYAITFISPGYKILYKKQLENIAEIIQAEMLRAITVDNTIKDRYNIINYNRIMNIPFILKGISLSGLKQAFLSYINMEKVPAIVVAAGPSLDQNINIIKKAKGKAFIIAVDSAIRLLEANGIEPDAFVTIDPIKPKVLFENQLAQKTPVFYCTHSSEEDLQLLHGMKIFCRTDEFILEEIKQNEEEINAGGNVASTAYSIAEYLGFKTIIAIGLDLAFKENKKHASIVYNDGGVTQKEEEAGKYTYVKGQNGEMLRTYHNFMIYKEWFESQIKESGIQFINATEGGAYLEGAEYMTFERAVEQFCTQKIDIDSIIKNCPKTFSEDVYSNIPRYLEKLEQECNEAKSGFWNCKKLYESLIKCKDTKKMQNTLHKIDKINIHMNQLTIAPIINDYSSKEVDNELEQLYGERKDDNLYQQVMSVARDGIRVSEIFLKNVDKTKKLIHECIMKTAEK